MFIKHSSSISVWNVGVFAKNPHSRMQQYLSKIQHCIDLRIVWPQRLWCFAKSSVSFSPKTLPIHRVWWVRQSFWLFQTVKAAHCFDLLEFEKDYICNTGNQNPPHRAAWGFCSTNPKINQSDCLWRAKNTPVFVGVSRGCWDVPLRVWVRSSSVDSSSIACSWITFLPVCHMLFPSCTGLDFLLWELGLFEEPYWACSLEGCQDKAWLTNTSKGSKLAQPNISSVSKRASSTQRH